MVITRLGRTLLAGAFVGALAIGSTTSLEARPVPVATAATIAGDAPVAQVWHWRHGGWGWRRHRRFSSGAFFAGAALGLIGGAAIASAAAHPYYYAPAYYPAYYTYPRVRVVRYYSRPRVVYVRRWAPAYYYYY